MSANHAILILSGTSAYDSIKAFNSELSRCIKQVGLDPIFLDMSDGSADKFNTGLAKALHDYPDRIGAAFSFSGFGIQIGDTSPEGNLWQRLQIPFLSWMLDHPAYFLARHKSTFPALMRLYPNRDFLDFHRDYVRSPYRTAYCPFGVISHGRQIQERVFRKEHPPLIICPKSCHNPSILEETWKLLPRVMQKIIHDGIDHYWGETARSGNVVNSVLIAADTAGVELRNDLSLFTFFITQLDDYIRRSKAETLIKQLMPLPVRIYGSGIDYLKTSNTRAEFLPPIDYEGLVELYFEASAVISMNQNIDDECHDRAYSALGAGAIPISDINPWWEKTFPELMPYSYDFRDRPIAAAIEKFLDDPERATTLAKTVSKHQSAKYSFDQMVNEALELALMHRYFTFNFKPPQQGYYKFDQ